MAFKILERPSRQIRVLYVMRVAFVLRSIEVYPAFVDLVFLFFSPIQMSILGWASDFFIGDLWLCVPGERVIFDMGQKLELKCHFGT